MKINPEVAKALKEGRAVVALESTIISHGMPYPRNVQTAMLVEKTVRDNGAVPATIGIIDGEITIGMTPEEIEVFGKRKGIAKVSKRDLPIIVAKKLWGATTVSATMTILTKPINRQAYNQMLIARDRAANSLPPLPYPVYDDVTDFTWSLNVLAAYDAVMRDKYIEAIKIVQRTLDTDERVSQSTKNEAMTFRIDVIRAPFIGQSAIIER